MLREDLNNMDEELLADFLYMMCTEDKDEALERWDSIAEIDENGEEVFAFELDKAKEVFGEELAQEMDEHIRMVLAKEQIEQQMLQDLQDGKIDFDDNGGMVILPTEDDNEES